MTITNNYNLPKVFEDAVNVYQHNYQADKLESLSVTDIIKPALMRRLEKEFHNQISEDITDRIWALTGQALHEVLSKHKVKNSLSEERLSYEIQGIKISGKFDMYLEDKTLQDYKFTNAWKLIYKDFEDWTIQLNIYKWLLEKHGFEVKKLEVIAILRDWQKSKSLYDANYPDCQIKIIEIHFLDMIENYINDRVRLHIEAETMLIENIPICTNKERWHKEDVFAVMKKNRKTAVKLFDNKEDAKKMVLTDKEYYLEIRQGEDVRCENYCRVKSFCPYKKNNDKDLNDGIFKFQSQS
jgi:hypothetical protein